MVSLNTIKNWFKNGLKPTQQQFSDTWDSFWHKSDTIPSSSIQNLDSRFNEKADSDALQSHLIDDDAHNITNRLADKQPNLQSGTNIKTINGQSILGGGDITIEGGGGSLPVLLPKQITFGATDGAIEQNEGLEFDEISGSLYVGTVKERSEGGGNGFVFGDSIAVGVGSTGGQSFGVILCDLMGVTPFIDGVSASTLEKREPINATGGLNMVDRISGIPNKTSDDKFLIFEFGINDVFFNSPNYTPENFKTDYLTVVGDALSKGWLGSQIVVLSTAYCNPGSYGNDGTGGTPIITEARHLAFNQACLEVSEELGTLYFDVFNYLKKRGGISLLSDGLHPNNDGHKLMALGILEQLVKEIFKDGQSLAVNGIAEFFKIVYKTNNILSDDDDLYLLGVSSNGHVGKTKTFPDFVRGKNLKLSGQFKQENAAVPGDLGNQDFLFKQGTKLSGSFNGNSDWYNSIEFSDSSVGMNIRLRYSQGKFRIWNTDGETLALDVRPGGEVESGKSFIVPYNNGRFASAYNPDEYYFEPFGESLGTNIRNSWGAGSFNVFLSGGANGGKERMLGINSKGRILIKRNSGDGGFQQAENCARLQLDSTDEGFLLSRMTSLQRDEMSHITSVRFAGAASGWTTATAEVVGGGGTGAEVDVILDGGNIVDFIVTNKGTGYVTQPTINLVGDGVAPPVIVVDLNIVKGLQIFNITTDKLNIYDGVSWKQPVVEEAD